MALFGRRRERSAGDVPARPLPVPPFAPDGTPRASASRSFVGADPVDVLGVLGVRLPSPVTSLQAATDLTVWRVPVEDGYPALDLWQAVRAVHPASGLWPVLVDDRTWEATADGLGGQPPPVAALDGAGWLQQRADTMLEEIGRGGEAAALPPGEGLDFDDLLAAADLRFTGLLLVAADAGWDVPGQLGWSGAVNHDILGDVHTALLRRWNGRYGVELVSMGLDTLGLRVDEPPRAPAEALEAAVEMTLYCPDLVFQGTVTVDDLAPHARSAAWLLWWD